MNEKAKRVFYFNYGGILKDRNIDVYSEDVCRQIDVFASFRRDIMDAAYVDDCDQSTSLWDRPAFIRLMKDVTSGKVASITTSERDCRDALAQISRIEEINEKAS